MPVNWVISQQYGNEEKIQVVHQLDKAIEILKSLESHPNPLKYVEVSVTLTLEDGSQASFRLPEDIQLLDDYDLDKEAQVLHRLLEANPMFELMWKSPMLIR